MCTQKAYYKILVFNGHLDELTINTHRDIAMVQFTSLQYLVPTHKSLISPNRSLDIQHVNKIQVIVLRMFSMGQGSGWLTGRRAHARSKPAWLLTGKQTTEQTEVTGN